MEHALWQLFRIFISRCLAPYSIHQHTALHTQEFGLRSKFFTLLNVVYGPT